MDNGIVLADLKIQSFIMIRKPCTVNQTVTDFCCVLNFMDPYKRFLYCVLKYCPAFYIQPFINASNDDRVEEKE